MAIEVANILYDTVDLEYETGSAARRQRIQLGLARISESLAIMQQRATEAVEYINTHNCSLSMEPAEQAHFLVIDNPRRPDRKVNRQMKCWQNDQPYSTGRLCMSHVALADDGKIYIKEGAFPTYKRELEYGDLLGAVIHDKDPRMDRSIINWLDSLQENT